MTADVSRKRCKADGLRVLLVDDVPARRAGTEQALVQEGFRVEVAPEGAEALRLARQRAPDAILSGVLLLAMDGFELCRAIRADPVLADLPVVLRSATFTGDPDRALAAAAGADDLVASGVAPEELRDRLLAAIAADAPRAIPAGGDFQSEHAVALRRRLIAKIVELEEAQSVLRAQHTASTEAAGRLHAHLAAIVDASPNAVLSTTPSGTIVSWNPGAERLYGYARDAAIGRPFAMLLAPARADADTAMFERIAGASPSERAESEHVRADGQTVPVALAVSPLLAPDGTVEGVSITATDITARRRHDAALADARAEAERANQAKSQFLSRMSHELRTPLNAILGFAQLLEMDDLEPSQRESVEQVLKGGRHLLAMIDEVLDISRIETGSMRLSLEPVEVASALREVLSLMAPIAAERRVALSLDVADAVAWYVRADRQRLRQIVINLVSNAIKYNRDGGRVTLSIQHGGPDRLRIAVADTGPGIDPAKIDRLFTPFDRLDAERGEVGGTGLGLALSRGLAERMNGTLTAESGLGRGTVLTLELDVATDPVGRVDMRRARRAGLHAAELRIGSVLYVEDNPANVRLIEQLFAGRRIQVLAAPQGGVGLELARAHLPDVILLDLHLPDIGGADVLAALKDDPATRAIPVIVLSADVRPHDIDRLRDAGAHELLPKPVDLDALLDVIRSVIPEPEVVP